LPAAIVAAPGARVRHGFSTILRRWGGPGAGEAGRRRPTMAAMRAASELREGFLSYFESKHHARLPSAALVPPPDDPTTLFAVPGMQPMKRWFLGLDRPPQPRVTTAQKVMRAGGKHNDLDDVGTTARHASFFEMLGNFSFGDYFKDGAVDLAFEFV